MLAKKKDKDQTGSSKDSNYVFTNIEVIINNFKSDPDYQQFLTDNNITNATMVEKINKYLINRNSKVNLGGLSQEQKDIIKHIFGANDNCEKFIYLFSIQHGIGGDESLFFLKDYLDMHAEPIERLLTKTKLYDNKHKRISLSQVQSGEDYYLEINYRDIDFEDFKTIVMLLQEGPNIRVQRQPINSTQMQTSTILLNTHIFNINRSESEIKAYLLQDKYLIWEAFRASGAGGQHVNKTSSAVRLRHSILTNVNITSQQERNQIQNRKTALKKLEEDITKEIMSLVKLVLSTKESNAGRNVKSTTYNYRRKQVSHEDGFQQTFESIKKDKYREFCLQRIFI